MGREAWWDFNDYFSATMYRGHTYPRSAIQLSNPLDVGY